MSSLEVRMLGSICFSQPGVPQQLVISRKVQSLLCYLALFRQRTHSRDSLTDLFWTDVPAEKARSCLNTAVWRARQALSQCGKSQEGFLVTTADGKVGFQADADYWCDAEEFEALATSALSESEPAANGGSIANLEASLRIYRGELLEGLYDDWALCERLRLSDLHERVLHRLMILLADSGALDRAIYYGNTLISADPLREDIHCSLMEYYHRQGNYNHCRRQYERCREAVKRELQCEPLEETTRLHHQLLKGSHRAKSDTSLPTAGRGGHLDEIRHSLRDAQAQLDRASKLFNQLITR